MASPFRPSRIMRDNNVPAQERRPGQAPLPPRKIASHAVLAGARTVIIVHGSEQYQLRVTQANRLILTK